MIQLEDEVRFLPETPYASWRALANHDTVVPGGVPAVIRSAVPHWHAAARSLDSLGIVGSSGAGSRPGGRRRGAW